MIFTKRIFDIIFSFLAILFLSPIFIVFMILIMAQDGHSPFYVPRRIGKDGKPFPMIKLRSMIVGADKAGIDTASTDDERITPLGKVIRRYKLDELFQLWNVLKGEMSVVGPRPNVESETRLYTNEEQRLLSVKPGLSDLSSIVFSDLGEIVANTPDTNISYNQLVRPWKSRLGLVYVDNVGILLDIKIIGLTMLSLISREKALKGVTKVLEDLNVSTDIIQVSKRQTKLVPTPPPGSHEIVTHR